jgi:hypothetical protein
MPQTIFLLSPAHCGGRRARMLLNPAATFPLAVRLRERGAPLGEIFQFMSGLYFRGKLAYAAAFGSRVQGSAALVIAPGRGLEPADTVLGVEQLQAMASIPVDRDEPRYRGPLERDARALARELDAQDSVVLLGSIASDKYSAVLERILPRLRFPSAFVGRGDMSRGGLMLRCARDGQPLDTLALAGAMRRGPRPPRLVPLPSSTRA